MLCRNLVFTYFDENLQRDLATRMIAALHDGGALVIGIHEHLPESRWELGLWHDHERIYRKNQGS